MQCVPRIATIDLPLRRYKLLDCCFSDLSIAGSLDKASKDVGTAIVGAPACGDVMKLQIRVGADGKIAEAKFKTFGCGSAIASR